MRHVLRMFGVYCQILVWPSIFGPKLFTMQKDYELSSHVALERKTLILVWSSDDARDYASLKIFGCSALCLIRES